MHSIATAVRGLAIALPLGLMIAAGTLTAAAAPSPNQPPGDPQNVQKLMGMLSGGYGPDTCQSIATDWQGQLAKVECQQNNDPNGPDWGLFTLYRNANDLRSDFKDAAGADQGVACIPGGDSKPHTWSLGNSNEIAGWLACGTYKDIPEIIWTNNAKNVLAVVEGRDISSLYQWWQTNG